MHDRGPRPRRGLRGAMNPEKVGPGARPSVRHRRAVPPTIFARMHLALMEPTDAKATTQVAALCAESGTSLHIIGPTDLPMTALEGKEAEGKLDLWIHPDWFEFRRAIARERCYYFSPDGGKEIEEARLRPTSVLMFSATGDLPERIKEKYPT